MLNPGDAESYAWLANVLAYVGDPPRHWSISRMRGDLIPCLRPYGTSISVVHCSILADTEKALTWLETCSRRAVTFEPLAPLSGRGPGATGEAGRSGRGDT